MHRELCLTNQKIKVLVQQFTFLVLLTGAFCYSLYPLYAIADLEDEHTTIQEEFPSVQHLTVDQLEHILSANSDEVVLFDVREKGEYAISHIKGAINVDPEISAEEFFNRHGDLLEGKQAVFYCAVGYRSSNLASLVQGIPQSSALTSIWNLQHGLFGWHNQEKQIVLNQTPTDYIHPYNFWWGRLLDRRKLIRYQPD